MPLVRVDALEGRSKEQIRNVLDAVHRAIVSAFKVPMRDRYQIYQEHPQNHLIVEDTGLGIERTNAVLVVTVQSRPRAVEQKQTFYRTLCAELKACCNIESSDIIVSILINADADWSFGYGRAQFFTGEL